MDRRVASKFDILIAEARCSWYRRTKKLAVLAAVTRRRVTPAVSSAARHCDLLPTSPTGWHDPSTMTNQGRDRVFWVVACCIFIGIGVAGWLIASFFLP